MQAANGSELQVAVGIVRDETGLVLVSERPYGAPYAGYWEFPGGKLEPGETAPQALRRELQEELAIEVVEAVPLITVRHPYPERTVRLEVYEVVSYRGLPIGAEAQRLAWVGVDALGDYCLLPANRPIVGALRLPPYYAILHLDPPALSSWPWWLEHLCRCGIRLVQLRAPAMAAREFSALAMEVVAAARASGSTVLVNTDPDTWARIPGAGLHLSSRRLMQLKTRPVPRDVWFSVAGHDPSQLQKAQEVDADMVLVGPVLPTPTHPGMPGLGWERFADLVAAVHVPVYALGGLQALDLPHARARGAQGIAAIRAFAPASM